MRSIDSEIKARLEKQHQTVHENNEHSMEIIVSRPRTAIVHQRYWQESIVTAGATAVCTSVAIKRTGRWGETVYVAYVDSTGLLTVKSAPLRFPIREMSWTTVTTIAGCAACALEFDGSFVRGSRDKVEHYTDALPWLFYTTTTGELKGGILGSPYESLVGANVTAIDAVRGVASKYKDIDQGLLVFYVIAGSLYYRDLIAGVWGDQTSVSIAPADIVSVRAERTFDYRIVLQVTDTSGALHEIFTKMESSGWNDSIALQLVGASIVSYESLSISYEDYYEGTDLKLTMTANIVDLWPMSEIPALLREAENLPIEMDGDYGYLHDDWGYLVALTFNQVIRNAEDYPTDFVLVDDAGTIWYGQEAYKDNPHSRTVYVLFTNFNNAQNPITATALAGNLWNGLTLIEETSVEFNAQNLVPFATEPPVVISIENIESWEEPV